MATPKKLVDRVDDGFATFAEWSIRMRWLIILTTLVLLCGGLYFAGKTRVDNSFDTFFNANDPSYVAYKEYLADFVSDEVIYIMYSAEETEHGPFDLEIMRTVAQLTGVLENEIPFAREATSLANVEFMRSVGEDDIEIDDLLIEFPETQQALLDIKTQVMAKPMYIDYLISRNAKYAAIIVQMERNSSDPIDKIIYDKEIGDVGANVYPTVSFNKLKEILARPEFANQGIQFYLSGDVPMNATYISILNDDMAYSIAGTLLVIVLVSMFLFRATLVGIVGPLSVVLLSVILTVGLLGLIGWPIGMFFSMVPTLICAVGVAQSVHILLEYQRQLAATGDRNESVKRALHKVGGPCLMAAVTTAVGFAVMTTSEMKALAEMGVYAPFGILISFFFSTTLLVVFLAGKPREKDESRRGEMAISPIVTAIVERAIAINTRYATAIILLSVAVFAVSFAGIANLRTDFNFLSEFKPSVTWRQHTEKIEAEMGGVLRMSYLIDTGVENGVKNPALIKRLGEIQAFAESHPLVKKSYSLADIMKDLNRSFHADNAEFYRVPDEQDLLAQYFLVYEFSGGDELQEFVSPDYSRTVIELQVEMAYATKVQEMLDSIDAYIAEHPLPNAVGSKTGIGLLWVKFADYIADTQVVSYSLVFAMIAVFMCISFGSIKVGLLSMIPNMAPVVLALGFLGWINSPLDYMKLLLATIAIGIAVDDTIHLVTRFRSRFYQLGNYQAAMEAGLRDVGPALVVTSIILMSSFLTFLVSQTTVLASFGLLLSSTIGVALIADLFLMPVLLMRLKPFGPEFEVLEETAAVEGLQPAS